MLKLHGTVKVPVARADDLTDALHRLGVEEVEARCVPFSAFSEESRLNWDFVFPEMISEAKDVVYLDFFFPDSDAGRSAAYNVEFNLPQVPLNLRYDEM